jgi:hypothetical protein
MKSRTTNSKTLKIFKGVGRKFQILLFINFHDINDVVVALTLSVLKFHQKSIFLKTFITLNQEWPTQICL